MDIKHMTTQIGWDVLRARVELSCTDLLGKVYRAIDEGTLQAEPMELFMLDNEMNGPYHETDYDGICWIRLIIDGARNFMIGVTDDFVLVDRYLDYDPLDGTIAPNGDLERYWFEFVGPIRKILGLAG